MICLYAATLALAAMPGAPAQRLRVIGANPGPFGLQFDGNLVGWVTDLAPGMLDHNSFSFRCGPGIVPALKQWVLTAPSSAKNGTFVTLTHSSRYPDAQDFSNAHVVEIGFPALDRSFSGPVQLSVYAKSDSLAPRPGPPPMLGTSPNPSAPNWDPSKFKVEFYGKPAARASRVDSFGLIVDSNASLPSRVTLASVGTHPEIRLIYSQAQYNHLGVHWGTTWQSGGGLVKGAITSPNSIGSAWISVVFDAEQIKTSTVGSKVYVFIKPKTLQFQFP